jgi:aminoglycoside phosphotransferase (APT) family kinase protein
MNDSVEWTNHRASLSGVLCRVLGANVTELRQLSGGASQQTWAFKAGEARFILRIESTGALPNPVNLAIGLANEAILMRRAREAGVPSPKVIYVLRPEDGLGTGFVQEFVDGETLGGRIAKGAAFAGARATLAYQCGEILARIHGMEPAGLPKLAVRTAAGIIQDLQVMYLYRAECWPRPVFELAFRWLAQRLPAEMYPARLVHGDFRNGNMIVGHGGVRAVLDWEIAYLGDPMADLGWLCTNSWRFGVIDRPVGGFGLREQLFAGYEAISGSRVDPDRVRFWEFVGSLRWGVMCTLSAVACRESSEVSVERPMIARRASETELDLIELMRSQ